MVLLSNAANIILNIVMPGYFYYPFIDIYGSLYGYIKDYNYYNNTYQVSNLLTDSITKILY